MHENKKKSKDRTVGHTQYRPTYSCQQFDRPQDNSIVTLTHAVTQSNARLAFDQIHPSNQPIWILHSAHV